MADMPTTMTSSRPYLIRAMYEWIVDNGLTPYLLVDATQENVEVPNDYVEDGRIVLNIGPGASRDLELGAEFVTFSARFSGQAMWVTAPIVAVSAVYAKENGQGMMFSDETPEVGGEPTAAPGVSGPSDDGPDDTPPAGGAKKRPSLRVVK
ncbi:stringent starvation protein B-like [Oratosquilla oratoria]|uniref:stringent starvation protein B-like n=1 Tax=Oratosquilla oratoria TaxID=337810 RepID=UPI003F76118F